MAANSKKVFLSSQALTASATSDPQTLSAKDKSFIGFLNVTDINAATTLNAKIQHSPDKSTWFDLVSFAALAGVTGNELKFPTTDVLGYVRSVVTLAGATQTATVTLELVYDADK